jgi:hypothetical protein
LPAKLKVWDRPVNNSAGGKVEKILELLYGLTHPYLMRCSGHFRRTGAGGSHIARRRGGLIASVATNSAIESRPGIIASSMMGSETASAVPAAICWN